MLLSSAQLDILICVIVSSQSYLAELFGIERAPGAALSFLGLTILLVLVAIAVAIFIFCGFKNEPYYFIDKENRDIQR